MEIKPVSLVLADISGYTHFIREHRGSLLHAEQIITDLLESVIDCAAYPLTLNKLEGDAVLLYTQVKGDDVEVARDVAAQVTRFFGAFRDKQHALLKAGDGGCDCAACVNIHNLRLKAVLHQGEAVIKRIRQFEELAGENVILIHRLLKNNLESDEYILMTEHFHTLSGDIEGLAPEAHVESYDDMGEIKTFVYYPKYVDSPVLLPETKRMSKPKGLMEGMRLSLRGILRRLSGQRVELHNLSLD